MDYRYLEDCPICQKISAGKIEKDSEHCYLVMVGSRRIAACKTHEGSVPPAVLADAYSLLRQQASDGFIADYGDAPGHWALHLINTNGMPKGKSEGKA